MVKRLESELDLIKCLCESDITLFAVARGTLERNQMVKAEDMALALWELAWGELREWERYGNRDMEDLGYQEVIGKIREYIFEVMENRGIDLEAMVE